MPYTYEELKARAFHRAAIALYSFWEEQKDNVPRAAAVHSRIFDTLIYDEYIALNRKGGNRGYCEHVVPCAFIRDHAFNMYWDGKKPEDVARMIGRLLHIAYITEEQANMLNSAHKSSMPDGWNPESDSPERRLEDAGIKLVDRI